MENNYKDISFNMSTKKMADVMYAMFMTGSKMTSFFHLGDKYNRQQNAYNSVLVRIEIHPQKEVEFQDISGCELKEIPKITLN